MADLLAVGRELLSPTLVDPATARGRRRAPQFPSLAGVLPGFGRHDPNPWGLGVEVRGAKHPHWTGAHELGRARSATSGAAARSCGSTPRRASPWRC